MTTPWYPNNVVARSLANALLGVVRQGLRPLGWPAWGEYVCVCVCTHRAPPLGLRRQVGELWKTHGSTEMLTRIKHQDHREIAETKLAKTG